MKKTVSKSFQEKKEQVQRKWHLIDMQGKVLGRTATQIATLLAGKHKPTYTAHVDGGDYVVVINAKEVVVTGNKRLGKTYYTHSQFPGGLKEEKFEKLIERRPQSVIETAVRGMLPKNKLRDPRMSRLKVFAGTQHPYQSHLEK